jgi:hypothetical protein
MQGRGCRVAQSGPRGLSIRDTGQTIDSNGLPRPERRTGPARIGAPCQPCHPCVVLPLDKRIALLAADLHRERKSATAHAIIYARAWHAGAERLTVMPTSRTCPASCSSARTPGERWRRRRGSHTRPWLRQPSHPGARYATCGSRKPDPAHPGGRAHVPEVSERRLAGACETPDTPR